MRILLVTHAQYGCYQVYGHEITLINCMVFFGNSYDQFELLCEEIGPDMHAQRQFERRKPLFRTTFMPVYWISPHNRNLIYNFV